MVSILSPILPLPALPEDGNLGPQLTCNDERKESEKPNSVATHTRAIGMIYPPPDIRNIVDKTVQFVAKVGPDFERMIMASYTGNAKFNFLTASDPYHAYYQHGLSELRAQNQSSAQQLPAADGAAAAAEKNEPAAQVIPVRKVVEPPEAEQYNVRLPEGITGEELDIIKLTAQFVARNGKSFLTGLSSREMNNAQFYFLKPTHTMFMFFTALADDYSKVLMPPKGLMEKLRKSIADRTMVLERCLHRLEWERSQEQAMCKAEDEIEQERTQMAMVDWHNFIVVETIEFVAEEDEALPMPMTLEKVIRRSKIVEHSKEVEMEIDKEEMQLVQEGVVAAMDEDETPMRIVKNWKLPEERISAKFVVSPVTGELIPTSEMSEHMRVSLIDPKYKEQKERMFAKIRETTLAHDDEISRNIVGLARTRPDIFGTTEEEVSNAVKAHFEEKKDDQPKQVIWDGHMRSIGYIANQATSQSMDVEDPDSIGRTLPGATAPPLRPVVPMARPLPPPANLVVNVPCVPTSNVQYTNPNSAELMVPPHLLVPVNQMVPPPPYPIQMAPGQQHMMMNLPLMPLPPMSMPQGMPPPTLPEEPKPKRQKLDYSTPIPEVQFLAQNPGPVRISISVPNTDEGNLKGQVLEITTSLSETVGSLKEKVSGEIQLPANKQKLSGKTGFLKDNLKLAFYNIGDGEILTLSLRERGGRKR